VASTIHQSLAQGSVQGTAAGTGLGAASGGADCQPAAKLDADGKPIKPPLTAEAKEAKQKAAKEKSMMMEASALLNLNGRATESTTLGLKPLSPLSPPHQH